ncbi:AAA family ATPase [Deinococcus sonorensis]|uniref:AAA family ATPase n=2 Tax=Deinococcus sonorensis TaxID=309891 RepID=A0AAU7UEM3_9DEIO
MGPPLLVVSGLPASGKTFLGSRLAAELQLPYVTKDEYKELLHQRLPQLSHADAGPLSFSVMYHVAEVVLRAGVGGVLETHFYLGVSEPKILELAQVHRARVLQVYCHAPLDLLRQRHAERVAAGEHPHIHRPELWERLSPQACTRPLDLDAPLLSVDTSAGVDLPAVLAWVTARLDGPA